MCSLYARILILILAILPFYACQSAQEEEDISINAKLSEPVFHAQGFSFQEIIRFLKIISPYVDQKSVAIAFVDLTAFQTYPQEFYKLLGPFFRTERQQAFKKDLIQYFKAHFGTDFSNIQYLIVIWDQHWTPIFFIGGDLPSLTHRPQVKMGNFLAYTLATPSLWIISFKYLSLYAVVTPENRTYFEHFYSNNVQKDLPPCIFKFLRHNPQKNTFAWLGVNLKKIPLQKHLNAFEELLAVSEWGFLSLSENVQVALCTSRENFSALQPLWTWFKEKLLGDLENTMLEINPQMPLEVGIYALFANHWTKPLLEALSPTFDSPMGYWTLALPIDLKLASGLSFALVHFLF